MTLLKKDGSITKTTDAKTASLNIKDGWLFGIGFGLAMGIAVPAILLILGCIIGTGIMLLGGSLGAML
jgi:hypothetical protein